ncbi:hypothetical protein BJF93_20010 [Xaviernesmea oryzae]|uniref:DUF624 domain-containing protein n=1 Tax=Xaviernesmea oryzae TaxID=464029 RepID=A0A1Q9AYT7_9HYPH|nr:DUF624 domain-containing protein [Xaviernesmea oryzae]OLP60609.1 hypothetical protein BJF93_20010 [Xaviernesmea oryzae]SEM33016.1 Protein of unknown function, DUF624 [Xaviernesmea oryzae]
MNWLAQLYLAEGPGIDKHAPRRRGLALVAETVWREGFELMKLNLLFVLACLPVVTIPAACAGLMRVSLSMAEDRNVYLLQDFLAASRGFAWKASLGCAGLVLALMVPAYAASTYGGLALSNPLYAAPFVLSLSVAALLLVAGAYGLVLMVRTDWPLRRLVPMALRAALAEPLRPLAALGFIAALWLVHVLLYPVSALMPAVVNFSFGALAVAFSVLDMVNRLIRAEEEPTDRV